MSDLEKGYLEKVYNPYGEETCDGYVKVEKNNNEIEYNAYLDCGGGNTLLVDSAYVNYGGKYLDTFNDIKKTKDGGYIVVGSSNSPSYGNLTNKNPNMINYDAIIVKYDKEGKEEWSRNFGGSGHDYFNSVIEVADGYIVVGQFTSQDGDLTSLQNTQTAIVMVKYSQQGNKIETKKLIESNVVSITTLLEKNGYYYIIGNGRNVTINGMNTQYIIKYNSHWNEIWRKNYSGNNFSSTIESGIWNEKGNMMIVGSSGATNDMMEDIKIAPIGITDAVMVEVNSETGEIIGKAAFGGTNNDSFQGITEVEDGYIVIGHGNSNDGDIQNLNRGKKDVYIVKYSKTADNNNIFPILWKKTLGGSEEEIAKAIVNNHTSVIVALSTNSNDYDITSKKTEQECYSTYFIEYDITTGDVLSKNKLESNNTDEIKKIIIDPNGYIVIGNSFSYGGIFEPFNFGNSDAFIMKLDKNRNPIKDFKLKTMVKSKPKELIKNYGNHIPTIEDRDTLKIYTTNDSTTDLGSWCTNNTYIDPNGNYNYIDCLYPFNPSNTSLLARFPLELSNQIQIEPSNSTNWLKMILGYGNISTGGEISNFKIQLENTNLMSIQEAVEQGYIEPLVLIGTTSRSKNYFFENSYNLLSSGIVKGGMYPGIILLIKPKNYKVTTISFNSDKKTSITDGNIQIEEFINFDLSLTKAE